MSSSDTDPTELERQHQREADKLEEHSKDLGQNIDDVSQDWQQKRADEGIPGAKMPDSPEDEDSDEEPEGKSDEDAEDQSRDESEDEESDEDDSEDSDDEESSEDSDSDEEPDENSED
jgi:hypothetical protein